MDHVAVIVGQDLDLDVPGSADQTLKEESVITESTGCDAAGSSQGSRQVRWIFDNVHAFAATTRGGLDQQRKSDSSCFIDELSVCHTGLRDAWDDWNAVTGNMILGTD